MNRFVAAAFALCFVLSAMAQTPGQRKEPLDGPGKPMKDELLDNLAGKWKITRNVGKRVEQNRVDVDWVLNHHFLQIHMLDVNRPPNYEAIVLIGYSNEDKRYVIYWLDSFGGKFSEKGYGTRDGNSIKFEFQYPDGLLRNTFTWNPASKTWRSLIEQQDDHGAWGVFAEDTYRR